MTGDSVLSIDAATRFTSSPAAPEFLATDMNDIVHAVAGCSRSFLSDTVLVIEKSIDLPPFPGNPQWLAQVLYALLFRAERSIAGNAGSIWIRTWSTEDDVRLSVSSNGRDADLDDA